MKRADDFFLVMRVWHSCSTARWFDMSSKLTNVMMRECDSFMKRADDFFVVMRLWRSSAARSFDVSACDLTWVRVSWWSRKGYEFVIQHEARTSKKIEMMQLWHSSAARWFNVSSWLMIKSQTLRSELCLTVKRRGGGLGSRSKKMYGERLGDGVEYHLMSPTPRR